MILQRYSRKPLSGWEVEEGMLGNGMRALPESQPLERESERTPLVWHLLGWITSVKLGLEYTWRVWKQEISGGGRDECCINSTVVGFKEREGDLLEVVTVSAWVSSEVVLWNCKMSFSFSIVSDSRLKFSHSSVICVVWLWYLAETNGILTFILPTKSKQSHSKNMIWFE